MIYYPTQINFRKIMNICVVTNDYPDSKRAVFPFVKNLVDKWGEMGHHVVVVAPFSMSRNKRLRPYKELPHSSNVEIKRPRTVSLSNIVIFGIRVSAQMYKYISTGLCLCLKKT